MNDESKHNRHPGYSEMRDMLENLPQTWCPALLATLVQTCVRKKVFAPGGMLSFVNSAKTEAEKQIKEPEAPAYDVRAELNAAAKEFMEGMASNE